MKADYDRIASTWDRARPISEVNIRLWLDAVSRRYANGTRPAVADLGCGTGRFAIPMAQWYGFDVIGVDSSRAMLAKAGAKDTGRLVRWLHADVRALPLDQGSLDGIFVSHLVHHLDDPQHALMDWVPLLRSGGFVFIRYGAMEHIQDDVVHRFFPATGAIDAARTPLVSDVEGWLEAMGLEEVSTLVADQQTYETVDEHIVSIGLRNSSVLTLIGDSDFARGFETLTSYVASHPGDPWLLRDRMALSVGRRPR